MGAELAHSPANKLNEKVRRLRRESVGPWRGVWWEGFLGRTAELVGATREVSAGRDGAPLKELEMSLQNFVMAIALMISAAAPAMAWDENGEHFFLDQVLEAGKLTPVAKGIQKISSVRGIKAAAALVNDCAKVEDEMIVTSQQGVIEGGGRTSPGDFLLLRVRYCEEPVFGTPTALVFRPAGGKSWYVIKGTMDTVDYVTTYAQSGGRDQELVVLGATRGSGEAESPLVERIVLDYSEKDVKPVSRKQINLTRGLDEK